ncbi:hypothetical protein BLNAU_1714 [Blattamonas nauphoetae]|uniref:Uncharacterized protein n=1 Tax=Blattamonas nauphoetae TaxID=2049346 RepID=A0ABQ9YHD7_9EUKA|nr:hypothetical protein BLNAU_1714 [Blattamonas nauphoetae]
MYEGNREKIANIFHFSISLLILMISFVLDPPSLSSLSASFSSQPSLNFTNPACLNRRRIRRICNLVVSPLVFLIFSLSVDDICAANTPLPLTPSHSSSASRNPTSPSSSIFTADAIHHSSPSIHLSLSL